MPQRLKLHFVSDAELFNTTAKVLATKYEVHPETVKNERRRRRARFEYRTVTVRADKIQPDGRVSV